MNIYLDWVLTILWYICWPVGTLVFYLVTLVLTVLKLLYWPIAFVLQPVVYLGRFIAACVALPFRALVKLEPLYNYIGVAALVGLLGGLALFYIYNVFYRLLRLDSRPQPKQRSVKQYRQDKAELRAKLSPPLLSPQIMNLSDGSGRIGSKGGNRNLLDQTILEEMDSDF